jgi:hypothetical protein
VHQGLKQAGLNCVPASRPWQSDGVVLATAITADAPATGDATLLERVDVALRCGAHNVLVVLCKAEAEAGAPAAPTNAGVYPQAFPNLNVSVLPQWLRYNKKGAMVVDATATDALRLALQTWVPRPAQAVLPLIAVRRPDVPRIAVYAMPDVGDLPLYALVQQMGSSRTIHLNAADGVCVVSHATKASGVEWQQIRRHVELVGTHNWGAETVTPFVAKRGDDSTWAERKSLPEIPNAKLLHVSPDGQWGPAKALSDFRELLIQRRKAPPERDAMDLTGSDDDKTGAPGPPHKAQPPPTTGQAKQQQQQQQPQTKGRTAMVPVAAKPREPITERVPLKDLTPRGSLGFRKASISCHVHKDRKMPIEQMTKQLERWLHMLRMEPVDAGRTGNVALYFHRNRDEIRVEWEVVEDAVKELIGLGVRVSVYVHVRLSSCRCTACYHCDLPPKPVVRTHY